MTINPSTYRPSGILDFGRYQAFTNDEGDTIQVPIEMVEITPVGREAEKKFFRTEDVFGEAADRG